MPGLRACCRSAAALCAVGLHCRVSVWECQRLCLGMSDETLEACLAMRLVGLHCRQVDAGHGALVLARQAGHRAKVPRRVARGRCCNRGIVGHPARVLVVLGLVQDLLRARTDKNTPTGSGWRPYPTRVVEQGRCVEKEDARTAKADLQRLAFLRRIPHILGFLLFPFFCRLASLWARSCHLCEARKDSGRNNI